MSEIQRRTGRTTRMLEHAQQLLDAGTAVVIVALNDTQASQLQARMRVHPHLRVKTLSELRPFDWERLTARGYSADTVYLVDHTTIEIALEDVLEMQHRWDPCPEKVQLAAMRDYVIQYALNHGWVDGSFIAEVRDFFDELIEKGDER